MIYQTFGFQKETELGHCGLYRRTCGLVPGKCSGDTCSDSLPVHHTSSIALTAMNLNSNGENGYLWTRCMTTTRRTADNKWSAHINSWVTATTWSGSVVLVCVESVQHTACPNQLPHLNPVNSLDGWDPWRMVIECYEIFQNWCCSLLRRGPDIQIRLDHSYMVRDACRNKLHRKSRNQAQFKNRNSWIGVVSCHSTALSTDLFVSSLGKREHHWQGRVWGAWKTVDYIDFATLLMVVFLPLPKTLVPLSLEAVRDCMSGFRGQRKCFIIVLGRGLC